MKAKSRKSTDEIQSRAVANRPDKIDRRGNLGQEFVDNRSDNLLQLKYQNLMDRSENKPSNFSHQLEELQSIQYSSFLNSWGTNIDNLGVLQMASLFRGSQISYDKKSQKIYKNKKNKVHMKLADFNKLQTAVKQMLDLKADRESLKRQLHKFFEGAAMILDKSLMAKQWTQLAHHLNFVDNRRDADTAELAEKGLLNKDDKFEAYELTGADPHKGGESTMILRYKTPARQVKRIVYKPADLTPEIVIFGGDEFRVKQYGGTYARPKGEGLTGVYGYMTYLEETGPKNAKDVQGIFRSLGEGLAIAYVYGLRDLHRENYKMLKNRIQWIDLEAMTGTFSKFEDTEIQSMLSDAANKMYNSIYAAFKLEHGGLFRAKRRKKSRESAEKELNAARTVLVKQLRAVDIEKEVRDGFTLYKKVRIPAEASEAAQWKTRFVPFPTDDLYNVVNEWHDKEELDKDTFPPQNWEEDRNLDWFSKKITLLKDKYPGAKAEVNYMMTAASTRAAVRRGDIPFFTRQGNSICGENGDVIIAKSTHPRLQSQKKIRKGIAARQKSKPPEALKSVIEQIKKNHKDLLCEKLDQAL